MYQYCKAILYTRNTHYKQTLEAKDTLSIGIAFHCADIIEVLVGFDLLMSQASDAER